MLLKIDFRISYESLFGGLSACSFRDLTEKRGYHGPFGWFSTLPSVSNKIEPSLSLQQCKAPIHFTAQRRRQDKLLILLY